MSLQIRPESSSDLLRITDIHNKAFGQEGEGILVERLRQTDDFNPELSLVAEIDGVVVGHILYYPIKIESDSEEYQTLSLAPVGVD